MGKKNNFYVVWQGKNLGIYSSWEECRKNVEGFAGAQYKGFETKEEAEIALQQNYSDYVQSRPKSGILKKKKVADYFSFPEIDFSALAVDAACSGNPGKMEYRAVWVSTGEPFFYQGPFDEATNNIGEFLAIVHALAQFKKQNLSTSIYSDSKIAIGWVKAKKCKTKLSPTIVNKPLFDLIRRAEFWLQNNTYSNLILKWQTDVWGEIPADFGRKK